MDYYWYENISATSTTDGADIKSQFGSKKCSQDLEPTSSGLTVEDKSGTCRLGMTLSAAKSKLATDKKSMTACTEDKNSAFGTGKFKGETTAYAQGIFAGDRDTSQGKRIELAVSVQFAAEGATSLLTTLGAVAFGVAAMAF